MKTELYVKQLPTSRGNFSWCQSKLRESQEADKIEYDINTWSLLLLFWSLLIGLGYLDEIHTIIMTNSCRRWVILLKINLICPDLFYWLSSSEYWFPWYSFLHTFPPIIFKLYSQCSVFLTIVAIVIISISLLFIFIISPYHAIMVWSIEPIHIYSGL